MVPRYPKRGEKTMTHNEIVEFFLARGGKIARWERSEFVWTIEVDYNKRRYQWYLKLTGELTSPVTRYAKEGENLVFYHNMGDLVAYCK
jgi:hypothetical protein